MSIKEKNQKLLENTDIDENEQQKHIEKQRKRNKDYYYNHKEQMLGYIKRYQDKINTEKIHCPSMRPCQLKHLHYTTNTPMQKRWTHNKSLLHHLLLIQYQNYFKKDYMN